jgi:hypothetical protein
MAYLSVAAFGDIVGRANVSAGFHRNDRHVGCAGSDDGIADRLSAGGAQSWSNPTPTRAREEHRSGCKDPKEYAPRHCTAWRQRSARARRRAV